MLDYTTEFPIKLGSSIFFQEPYNNNNFFVQGNLMRWKIVKNVVISDEEYEAWNSCYVRRDDDIQGATASSIQRLEVVKLVEDEDDSISITRNCLALMFFIGFIFPLPTPLDN
ncbi:hypothetical protein M9H77_16891 [Catharanthus roseus]|uniref:Uncharacterized protein n=1 Tax=Catharanthus roseus TaxID=4058 RepID=A0ACC0B317_CATRO|nr:hypothetical protein M9H77_16891 [Catharanthus roseus]